MKHNYKKGGEKMRRLKRLFVFFMWMVCPATVLAGEGGKEPLHHVADVSKATNFFTRWLAETYNNNRLLHSIACVIIMGIMGIILAYITDWIMAVLGYKAEKMEHRE